MSMVLFVLLGAAFAGLALDLFDSDSGSGGSSEEEGSGGDDVILVDDGTNHTGDDGRQVYTFDPAADGPVAAMINAGGGDDVINLTLAFDQALLLDATIDGGAGGDFISVEADSSAIAGGTGNDTILAEITGSTVNGGAGNDEIRVDGGEGDISFVYGEFGDDSIDGRGMDNVSMSGGAGDDVLISSGQVNGGTGFAIVSNGGLGDDTLLHEVGIFPPPEPDLNAGPAILVGGDGADSFEIVLTANGGSFTASDTDPAVLVNNAVRIQDFEVDIDQLTIDLSDFIAGYTAESGTLTLDTTTNSTLISLRLVDENGGLPDQDVQITVNATGLTWDDVAFVGPAPTTLSTATVA